MNEKLDIKIIFVKKIQELNYKQRDKVFMNNPFLGLSPIVRHFNFSCYM